MTSRRPGTGWRAPSTQLVYRASPKTIVSRQVASVKGYFVAPDGTPRTDNILKVAGVVAGVVAVFVGLRRLTR